MEELSGILQVLKEHVSEVTTCDISHSNELATGAGDKTVWVYEWRVGKGFSPKAFSPLSTHKYGVTWVRFSPQGTMLASASLDGTTVLWNPRTGARIHTLVQATRCSVRRVEFTPDSSKLVTAGDDGVFCLWDLIQGSLFRSLRLHDEEDACAQGLAISFDGQLMVTGDTGGLLQLWALSSDELECLSFHRGVNNGVTCCAFSPSRTMSIDGDLKVDYELVTAGCDGVIRIWAVRTVRGNKDVAPDFLVCDLVEIGVLDGHSSDVHDLRFNNAGTMLGSIGLDKVLKVWQMSDGECLQTLTGHNRYGNCCAFTKDSSIIVSGSNDRTVIVWDLTGKMSRNSSLSPPCTVSSHFCAEPTAEQEQLMASHVENQASHLELVQIVNTSAAVNSVAFGGSGLLAVAGGDRVIRVMEKTIGEDSWTDRTLLDRKNTYQLAFSPCGSKLIACANDGVLNHWDLQTGLSFEMKTEACSNGLRTCAFSPNADIIATAGDDEIIFLWDSASLEFIKSCQQHRDAISNVCFSPDGRLLASTCIAGDIALYDLVSDSTCLMKDNAHDLGASCCHFAAADFLPAGEVDSAYVLATCGNDSIVRIWRAGVGVLQQWLELTGHGVNAMCVQFSTSTPYLLASSATDCTVRIWDAKTGNCLRVLEHHSSMVNSCAFSQDSSYLITGSLDKTAAIWRLPLQLASAGMPNFRLSKRIQHWSADDVAAWFRDFGHIETAGKFLAGKINGRIILQMDEESIIDQIELDDEDEKKEIGVLLWWAKQAAQNDRELELNQNVPHQFLCPITHDIMRDPVLCADGFTYERAAITEWMLGGRFTSPMTNEPLQTSFQPNSSLKKLIYQHLYGEKS